MSENAEGGKPPVGTPPIADDKGESGKPKMFTEEEAKELADRKLRGVLKEHDKDKKRLAELEAAEEKRKQENLSKEELLAKERAEKAELLAWRKAREEAEAAEVAEIEEENKARIRELKKEHPDMADLIPEGLTAKALSKWLARLTVKITTQKIDVHGGSGRSRPLTDEDKKKEHDASIAAKGAAFIFGPSKKDQK